MEFLRSLTLFPTETPTTSINRTEILKNKLHQLLKQTRSYHLVENFCFVVAGRNYLSSSSSNSRGRLLPPVSNSRIPFPEQLQQVHNIVVTKLGFVHNFRWLENQLIHEGQMCHGVIANHGEGRLDDDEHSSSLFPDHYPVMNYIAEFGDESAPEPTMSGNMDHIDRIDFEDPQGKESALAKRMREQHGFNVKTEADFEK
jgi:hypothetical protein